MFSSPAQCLVLSMLEETDLGPMVYVDWRLWSYYFVAMLDTIEELSTTLFR